MWKLLAVEGRKRVEVVTDSWQAAMQEADRMVKAGEAGPETLFEMCPIRVVAR